MTYIFIVLIILLINFMYNILKFLQCGSLIRQFEKWLLDPNFKGVLQEKKSTAISLVKNAGCYDIRIPFSQSGGYGQIVNTVINPIDQFPNRVQDIAYGILSQLSSSKGVYKGRALASFNPFAWLEFIIYLPSNIIGYLGFKKNNTFSKVMNILWWVIAGILIPMLLNTYSEEIEVFIRNIFS